MAEGLGLWLRRRREARDLSLDEVEEALRIRRRYLQALEVGDYAALPGPIQARGFIRNYARFLQLPVEEALSRYQAEVEGRPFQPRAQSVDTRPHQMGLDRPTVFAPPPSAEEEAQGFSNRLPPVLWVLVGAMILFGLVALISLLYLQFNGVLSRSDAVPTPTLAATAVAVNTPVSESGGEQFSPSIDGTVSVRLVPQGHAWIRVVADDAVVFQGVATPEEPIEAVASDLCTVETGNGGAFQLFLNGEDFGSLGEQGRVVRRAWTPAGEVSPEGS
jgi:transcriptional regulator with XRE-family HTH domain